MKTFTLELRCDYDDEAKYETVKEAMKTAAKHVYTIAQLIKDKRDPQIALEGSDFFSTTEEISLADDIPQGDEEGDDLTGSINHMPDENEHEPEPDDEPCRNCGAVPGTEEYGTVGDGFDGLCPSCADKAEEDGERV